MTAARGRPGPVSQVARRRAQRMVIDRLPELAQRAVDLALLGDPVCLKACLDRAWPVPQNDASGRPGDRP